MKYERIVKGKFLARPNRFVADVEIRGEIERVHVKNTGRCRELLIPGVSVYLEESTNPERKTKYDLVAVEKEGLGIVNIDSQAPNKVMGEWLAKQGYDYIKPEYKYGNSRMDFYLEKSAEKTLTEKTLLERTLIEVKGCTLEIGGIGYFPDAPTERGVKHIRELIKAKEEGYRAILAFVIQMEGIYEVRPNMETHPQFGEAMDEARSKGVEILMLPCRVTPSELEII